MHGPGPLALHGEHDPVITAETFADHRGSTATRSTSRRSLGDRLTSPERRGPVRRVGSQPFLGEPRPCYGEAREYVSR